MIDVNDPAQVKRQFASMLIAAELVTPSQLDGQDGASIGKFAANARRLRQGEITVEEFEAIVGEDS
ncbi:hypothetical protein [Micromonospora sp. NPDC048839]|uniref:hypothetical protein n=1 Tax=Micromonospora sp. NPDC048839 TaxID=3155641 RepID=UPI00340319A1